MKVKRKILFMLVLFSVIPMILVTAFCVERFTSESMKLIDQNIATASQVQANHLQNFFDQQEVNLRANTKMPEVTALFSSQGDALEKAKQETTRMLDVRASEQSFVISASIVNLEKNVVVSTDPTRVGNSTLFSDATASKAFESGFQVTSVQTFENFQGGKPHLAMSYPITVQGQVQGFLVAVFDTSYFDHMIQNTSFFRTGTVTVMDSYGNVAATNSDYLVSNIDDLQNSDLPSQWEAISSKIDKDGILDFSANGVKRIGCYSELSGTGWSILTAVDRSEITTPVWVVVLFAAGFLLLLLLLILLSGVFINRSFSRPLEKIVAGIEQMRHNDHTARIHYSKNNEFGQISAAFNELMDHVEEDNRELRASETRYRIVTEQADSIIFEYNIREGTIYHSSNWKAKFGYDPIQEQFIQETMERAIVHPDEKTVFLDLFESFEKGESLHGRAEMRLRKSDGSYLWCSVVATAMTDESAKPYKVIGKITDIDRQKREEKILRDKAERDPLTGLYNRATTEALISRCLETGGKANMHALLVIDIDNFKSINDNLGHLFGDAVLSEISAKLLSIFRVSDVVGRIGGDEFVVFLNKLPSEQLLFEWLDSLIEVFRHSYAGRSREYKISGSIGAAIFPRDGASYKELFSNADSALYAAKIQGKDCYHLYDHQVRKERYNSCLKRTPESQKSFHENVSEYIFQILYQTNDINSAVQMILDIVGRYYNVSRAYVFEYTEDGQYMNNTFEWCNTGIAPQIEHLQHISNVELGGYSNNFKDSNIFYVKDINELNENTYRILAPQGIRSMLQCAVLDDGNFRGYVGFDECNKRRYWTQEEIETLSFVSKILSVFLVKMRTQGKLERSLEQTRSILDTQDMWTYVVDCKTYELLFINRKTLHLAPAAQLGDKCYEAFWGGRKTPCERCPMNGVTGTNQRSTMKIFNDHFQVWTNASASPLEWGGRKNVCLICCSDITNLQQSPQEDLK